MTPVEVRAEQYYDLKGLFDDRQDAMNVLDRLKIAQFDIDDANVVEAVGVRDLVRQHRLALTRSGALAGATVGGVLAFVLSLAILILVSTAAAQQTVIMMTLLSVISIVLCTAFGAYYAMFHNLLDRDSVVLGVHVPQDRLSLAKSILRAGGAGFLSLRRITRPT